MALFESLVVLPFVPLPRHDGPTNMAMDEWLTLLDEPALRIYGWTGKAVTFGYFQRHGAIDTAFPGKALTRRWTGGGAVAHGDSEECTYALAVPGSHPFARLRPVETYRALHGAVADALRRMGLDATVVANPSTPPNLACFQGPVPGDVTLASGQKVAGAAQRRTRRGLLIQGSVRLPDPIPEAFPSCLTDALTDSIEAAPTVPQSVIASLVASKYGCPQWLDRVP